MLTPLFHELPIGSRILFIRLRNLGEAVLDTANLRALKRFRPDLELTTLVETIFADLFISDPDIETLPLERAVSDRRSSLRARLEIVREIRRRNFAAIVNLHGGPASAQLTALSGVRERAGAGHFRFRYVYNRQIPPAEEILGRADLHTVESQFAWFRWLGLPDEEPGPEERAWQSEHERILKSALESLPPKQRQPAQKPRRQSISWAGPPRGLNGRASPPEPPVFFQMLTRDGDQLVVRWVLHHV